MKTAYLLIVMLGCGMTAKADFSYSQTRKSSQAMTAAGGEATTKHFLKGQKMKVDSGKTASIFDFDAQTVTVLDNQQKTYTVTPFGELGKGLPQTGMNANVDVKETGQKKVVNGFNASEVVMTIAMQSQQGTQATTMSVEMDMWISNDVPGAKELRAFYAKNGDRFPWAALGTGGGNPGMQKAIADMQKKMASIGGVPVMQITRMKAAGNPQMSQQMEQARAKFEEMKKQGGQQAAIAEQMLARMGGGSGGAMFEITMESSGFSVSPIADSVFAVPGDYRKVTK